MTVLVLDAGALVALERGDRGLWTRVQAAALHKYEVCVPSAVVAQVWRGTPRQARLARALQYCAIASFDARARAIGELCGRTRTRDVCDAQVALVAAERGDVVYTSDPGDLRRLIEAVGRRRPMIIRC